MTYGFVRHFPELQKFLILINLKNKVYLNKIYWHKRSDMLWNYNRNWVDSAKLNEVIRSNCDYISHINLKHQDNAILLDIRYTRDSTKRIIISIREFDKFLRIGLEGKVNWKKEGF